VLQSSLLSEFKSSPISLISSVKHFVREKKNQLSSVFGKALQGAIYLKKSLDMKSVTRAVISMAVTLFAVARHAKASAVGAAPIKSDLTPAQGVALWGALFALSATLHSAESAITKLSHWKVGGQSDPS
jgi:hypothetical protein